MPFRDRMRKAFGRSRSNSDNSDHSATGSKPLSPTTSKPKPKDPASDAAPSYRRRLPEAHQARMAAFSWANNNPCSRHMSDASQYSPKGSRVPTRENSRSSVRETKSMQSTRRRGPHLVDNAESDDFVGSAPATQHGSDRKPQLHRRDPDLEDRSKMMANGGTYGDAHFTDDQLATAIKQSMLHAPNGMANGITT